MDNGQWSEVRKEAEDQGWIVDDTRSGYQLKSPDRRTIVTMDRLHKSSDPYALARTVRRMSREGGFRWPPSKRRKSGE
jgi:hypothetical protein